MTLALVHVGARRRVPAEVVIGLAALVALEHSGRIDEGVVVQQHVGGVQHPRTLVTTDEDVSGDGGAAGYLEEKAVGRAFDPIVDDHPVAIAHVVPDAVRMRVVDDQVVPDDFWNTTRDVMADYFQKKAFKDGIIAGIRSAGQELKAHFPWGADDRNELPDAITKS